ncbi:proteasome activator pa28, REG alpha/beta subunit [Violaceomyces palustris]|uniref:Proteasome activator pa28, REG alpha/beta subunit n=1 Tax=Violaceomyces palustris TaxID=1673888 RepID=A0ACD0P1E7_9BASI|nr:proteasome activator pa28, REG alpha/beta subunit [Violaceomyces palustris]
MSTNPIKIQLSKELDQSLEEFNLKVKEGFLNVIQESLPKMILRLNRRIQRVREVEDDLFNKINYFAPERMKCDYRVSEQGSGEEGKVEQGFEKSKKRKVAEASDENGFVDGSESKGEKKSSDSEGHTFKGSVKGSEYMVNVFDELRKDWDEIISQMDAIKMYINLQMPKIEDGDTFGVSVQEEALGEVVRTQDSAYSLLSTPYSYFSARGEIASKRVRFPGVEDFELALRELDRNTIYKARLQINDMRNMCAVVLDIVRKNINKISKPKSGNQMENYG